MLRNKDIHNTWLSNVAEKYNWSLGTQIILSQKHIVTWLDLCSEKRGQAGKELVPRSSLAM